MKFWLFNTLLRSWQSWSIVRFSTDTQLVFSPNWGQFCWMVQISPKDISIFDDSQFLDHVCLCGDNFSIMASERFSRKVGKSFITDRATNNKGKALENPNFLRLSTFYIVSETPMLRNHYFLGFFSKTKIYHSSPKVVDSWRRLWHFLGQSIFNGFTMHFFITTAVSPSNH